MTYLDTCVVLHASMILSWVSLVWLSKQDYLFVGGAGLERLLQSLVSKIDQFVARLIGGVSRKA